MWSCAQKAEVVSFNEEEQLWAKGVFCSHTPVGLLHVVFLSSNINFVLCGGSEHHQLKISQLNFAQVLNPDTPGDVIECVQYTEHVSKNRQGGRHQLNLDNKTAVHYSRPELRENYHVHLLHLYLSKLPESAIQRNVFYTKARGKIPEVASEPWYCNQPLGQNMLDCFLKEILAAGDIGSTNKSNHSLRATGISHIP